MKSEEFGRFLTVLQRVIEPAPITAPDRLRALRALSGLAGCTAQGVGESSDAFAHVATLLSLSQEVPVVQGLLDYYPMLFERGE